MIKKHILEGIIESLSIRGIFKRVGIDSTIAMLKSERQHLIESLKNSDSHKGIKRMCIDYLDEKIDQLENDIRSS